MRLSYQKALYELRKWIDITRSNLSFQLQVHRTPIDTFVNVVFVYDDKLVLTYNYQYAYRQLH